MKNILLIAFLAIGINANAQITLEHTYDSAGYYFNTAKLSQLYVVKLEVDGYKYVFVDRTDKLVKLYNLNHTHWKSISFAAATDLNSSADVQDIMYISQHLFDTDNEIEFLYVDQNGPGSAVTQVINEDGSILFTATNQAPFDKISAPLAQLPIYNTSAGTKMILSGTDGNAYVYSLPGTLSNLKNIGSDNSGLSVPYPNPANDMTKIDYHLPVDVNKGEIVFFDIQGNEIKRFSVDQTFTTLLVSTSDIAAGTYYYQLQTAGQKSEGKKLIVIK